MRGLLKSLVIALAIAAPLPASADTVLKPLVTGNDSRGWDGVGRIDFGGRSFCTGSLISEDLVLTAAHCLYRPDTGEAYAPGDIQFLAGWRNGRAAAYRGVRLAMAHPDYLAETDRTRRVAHDLALLQLDQPVRMHTVSPFATEKLPRKGAEVGVVSYAHDRPDSPALQEMCHVLARQSGVLVLSCDIDFGSSGAPVFVLEGGVPTIVSVISSKADSNGSKVALGTDLQAPLADLRRLMAKSDGVFAKPVPVTRKLSQDGGRQDSGAKFLRP